MTAHASPSPPGLLREPLLAAALAEAAFQRAAQDDRLRGWATFWLGVLADNLRDDATAAAAQVTLAGALEPGDEWTTLFQAARHTADDLDLTWLRASLRDPA